MGVFNGSAQLSHVECSRNCFEIASSPVSQNDIRFVVIIDPADGTAYSVSIRHIRQTDGLLEILSCLSKNEKRKHKKHVQAWMCQYGDQCTLQNSCPNIHITPEGHTKRRVWYRPLTMKRLSNAAKVHRSSTGVDDSSSSSVNVTSDSSNEILSNKFSIPSEPLIPSYSHMCTPLSCDQTLPLIHTAPCCSVYAQIAEYAPNRLSNLKSKSSPSDICDPMFADHKQSIFDSSTSSVNSLSASSINASISTAGSVSSPSMLLSSLVLPLPDNNPSRPMSSSSWWADYDSDEEMDFDVPVTQFLSTPQHATIHS
jgi:hypothetical protein